MAIKLNNKVRSSIVDNLISVIHYGGYVQIYTGSAPSTADAAPTGNLLVEIDTTNIWGNGASNGTSAITLQQTGESGTGGIAGYARWVYTAGELCVQGNVGTAATCDFQINKGTFGVETITLLAATIIQPAG